VIARRLAVALATIALVPVVLAGCSLPGSGEPEPGNTGDNGAATSGPAPDAGGGDVQIPATFPPEIPLVDGRLLESADLGTGWVVLFGVDDAIASFTSGADALAASGFEEQERTTNETQGFANYANDLYTVQLSANTDYPGYGQAVAYTVVKRG